MTPVTKIQQLYQEYAFLPDPQPKASDCSEAEMNVSTIWQTIIDRTYEAPYKWYFIVFAPIDRAYAQDPDFFRIKGLDKCRSMFKKPQAYILTREILDCAKIHVNALVCTDQDLLKRNTKIFCNKYYVHAQLVDRHHSSLNKVLSYITKESKKRRTLYKYLDYLHWTNH